MRRVVYSALIGGLVGIAVLFTVAMLKTSCWRDAQCCGWSTLLLPVTHFQVRELMISGQMLHFKKECLEFGFDYFVRGAGIGISMLLLLDAGITRLRKQSSAMPAWMVGFADFLSNHTSILVKLAWSIPLLVSMLGFFYFLADGYLDATSIAILVPSLVLMALVLAAALKKRLFLWQVRDSQLPTTATAQVVETPHTKVILLMSVQFAVYWLSPLLALYALDVCSHHLHWEDMVREANAQSTYPTYALARRVLIVETMNILVSVFSCGVFIYFIEVILYKILAREKLLNIALFAGPLFNASLICWSLMWLLPAIHLVLFSPYLVGVSHRAIAMEIFRISTAFSTVPSSIFGFTVAFTRVKGDNKR